VYLNAILSQGMGFCLEEIYVHLHGMYFEDDYYTKNHRALHIKTALSSDYSGDV